MRLATQRARDLLLALAISPLVLPIFATLILVVAIETRGKPLFRQRRVGYEGRMFRIFKIESFREHPTEFSRSEEISLNDPRLTFFGGFLRRYKLDELAQILNVLKGDMSFVGPRPDLPSQAVDYDHVARQRLNVKPGLTGIVQISGNASLSWNERFILDAWYVKNQSLCLDLKILMATPLSILRGESRNQDPFGVHRFLKV